MTSVQLPKTGLIKQDYKDKRWEGPLNQGFDSWEARVGVAGGTSPIGVAQGFYLGQTFLNTATGELYFCIGVGNPGTWKKIALEDSFNNFGNFVSLASGANVAPEHHHKVLSYPTPDAGSWTFLSGGYSPGWTCKVMCAMAGSSVTLIAASGQSFVTMGLRLNSLSLTFPDEGDLYSPDGVNFYWSGTRHFTSPTFQLNAGTGYDFTHSLGVQPQRVIVRLSNIVPDLGYVPGDVIHINTDTQAANYGIMSKSTASQVSAKIAVAGIQLIDWVQGIVAPITTTSWQGNLRADVVN